MWKDRGNCWNCRNSSKFEYFIPAPPPTRRLPTLLADEPQEILSSSCLQHPWGDNHTDTLTNITHPTHLCCGGRWVGGVWSKQGAGHNNKIKFEVPKWNFTECGLRVARRTEQSDGYIVWTPTLSNVRCSNFRFSHIIHSHIPHLQCSAKGWEQPNHDPPK